MSSRWRAGLHGRTATPAPATAPVPVTIGLLMIELARHRRMRMNGRAQPAADGLRVCWTRSTPTARNTSRNERIAGSPSSTPGTPRHSHDLTYDQQEFIAGADTFFISTADRDGNADASRRGWNPGFVQVLSPTVLRWPDYIGNAMFNALGNLEVNPSAGLLFPDWRTGTTVQLTRVARTDRDPVQAVAVPGAQRLVEFTVTHAIEIPAALPLRWTSRCSPASTRPPR